MMIIGRRLFVGMWAIILLGCAAHQPESPSSTEGTTFVQGGQVTDIRDVTTRNAQTSGAGSFIGALVGSILGSRLGSGNGQTAGVVGGALAGGVAGNAAEQSSKPAHTTTELSVRLDNGSVRTYAVKPDDIFHIGDRVTVTTSKGMTRVTH